MSSPGGSKCDLNLVCGAIQHLSSLSFRSILRDDDSFRCAAFCLSADFSSMRTDVHCVSTKKLHLQHATGVCPLKQLHSFKIHNIYTFIGVSLVNLGWDLLREWLSARLFVAPLHVFFLCLGLHLTLGSTSTSVNLLENRAVCHDSVSDRIMCSNSVIIHGRAWFVVLPFEGAVFTPQKQKCGENGCGSLVWCGFATSLSSEISSVEISSWRMLLVNVVCFSRSCMIISFF